MTRWQAVSRNGRRGKGKKGRTERADGRMGSRWGICDFSFPAQSGTRTTRAEGMAQLMCCSYPSALDCGETRQTARCHLGRRPWPHVLTARCGSYRQGDQSSQVPTSCRLSVEQGADTGIDDDGWQLVGLGLSSQWKAPRATNHPSHACPHGNLRLASSAQPDRSINHRLISGNPSISQVMVCTLPSTIAVKC